MKIGIDIGGTKANILLIEGEEIVARTRIATGYERSCKETIEIIAAETKKLMASVGAKEATSVGIGIPGTVNNTTGMAINIPNLHWLNEPVSEYFIESFGMRPILCQDTRAAAWAEARRRTDKRCVVCVTLGTGIGCGIVMDRKIWHGTQGTAGEIGHIPVVLNGRQCACGRKGCMEAYASGTGMKRTAVERGVAQSSPELFEKAKAGDESCKAVIAEAAAFAAQSIVAATNVLSPDVILFSGGLSKQTELFVEPIIEHIREWGYPQAVGDGLEIGLSELDEDAPAIGAAHLNEVEEMA